MKKIRHLKSAALCLSLIFTNMSAVALATGATEAANAHALPDFTRLIKENGKTVVQITAQLNEDLNTMMARQFFAGPEFNAPRGFSYGSGFFIDKSGHILTNAHVIEEGAYVTVVTAEEREYRARIVGTDKRTDLALLKIEIENAPAAKIGNSDKVEVGNWVLAIGNPYGFSSTATKGIVSAMSRSFPEGTYVPFIQTDAAVNPGNSGGPLFNLAGEVIGINSRIYSKTGSFNGLAFAIPINTAMNIAKQLKEQGFVNRGWLGVSIQPLLAQQADALGLPAPKGAFVGEVTRGSPAEKAGILKGDVILRYNNVEIVKSSDLPPLVGTSAIDSDVAVTLFRQGKTLTVTVHILALDEGQPKIVRDDLFRGLQVRSLSDKEKAALMFSAGVVVHRVQAGSRAEKAGFLAGDVLINMDNQQISDIAALKQILQQVPKDKPVAVLLFREGRSFYLAL